MNDGLQEDGSILIVASLGSSQGMKASCLGLVEAHPRYPPLHFLNKYDTSYPAAEGGALLLTALRIEGLDGERSGYEGG